MDGRAKPLMDRKVVGASRYLSFYLSIYLSTYLSIYLSLSLFLSSYLLVGWLVVTVCRNDPESESMNIRMLSCHGTKVAKHRDLCRTDARPYSASSVFRGPIRVGKTITVRLGTKAMEEDQRHSATQRQNHSLKYSHSALGTKKANGRGGKISPKWLWKTPPQTKEKYTSHHRSQENHFWNPIPHVQEIHLSPSLRV